MDRQIKIDRERERKKEIQRPTERGRGTHTDRTIQIDCEAERGIDRLKEKGREKSETVRYFKLGAELKIK